FTDQMLIALVAGVDGHGGIAEHRLWPRRREADEFVRVLDLVAKRPEAALDRLVVGLVVGHGGLELRVPIDEPFAPEDQAVAEPLEKRLAHGPRAAFVEREARARPVAGAAELAELAEDAGLVLVLPGPDTFHQLFAAEIVARLLFLGEDETLDDGLRGDTGMV